MELNQELQILAEQFWHAHFGQRFFGTLPWFQDDDTSNPLNTEFSALPQDWIGDEAGKRPAEVHKSCAYWKAGEGDRNLYRKTATRLVRRWVVSSTRKLRPVRFMKTWNQAHFHDVSSVFELRMMLDFNGNNRGFCFVTYQTRNESQAALKGTVFSRISSENSPPDLLTSPIMLEVMCTSGLICSCECDFLISHAAWMWQISNFVITPCFFAEMRNETVERMDLFSVKFEMVENPEEGINNFEIRKGRLLGACQSVDNCRLFVGGIPKTKKRDEIMEEMKKVTEGKNREFIIFTTAYLGL